NGGVPSVREPGVLDVDGKLAPLSQVHRCWARLRDDELRGGYCHRWRDAPFAWQGLIEHSVNEPAEVPVRRVDELFPRHVRGRVVKLYCERNDELPSRGNDGKVVERQHTADVGKGMRNLSTVVDPSHGVADVAEIRTCCVEVVRDGDAVQVVRRPA